MAGCIGLIVCLGIFYWIDRTSLDGFYHAEMKNQTLHLHYILPQDEVVVPLDEIGEVSRTPTFKLNWRLKVFTKDGNEYESANASRQAVKGAWEQMKRRLRTFKHAMARHD
jgi:hypothetical protein